MKKVISMSLSLVFVLITMFSLPLNTFAAETIQEPIENELVNPTEYLHLEKFTVDEVLECSYEEIRSYLDACRKAYGIDTNASADNQDDVVSPMWGSNWQKKEDVIKTHETITFLSVCVMFADKRAWKEDVLSAIGEAGMVAVWSAEPDNVGNGVLLDKMYAGHFYNPITGTNNRDETYPTAKSNAKEHYDLAVEYMKAGDRNKGLKYLGYTLHYIQDSGEPHHAANISALKIYYNNAHSRFEKYVDENLEILSPSDLSVSNDIYSYALRNSPSSIVEICATAGYNEKDNVCQWGTPDYEIWKTVAKKQLRIVASYGAAVSYKFAIEAGMYN